MYIQYNKKINISLWIKLKNEKLDLCPMDHNYKKKVVFYFGLADNFMW